jgi:hypothetical protein
MKKIMAKPIEMAMNTGVVAVGAVRRSGALLGRLERSVLNHCTEVWECRPSLRTILRRQHWHFTSDGGGGISARA